MSTYFEQRSLRPAATADNNTKACSDQHRGDYTLRARTVPAPDRPAGAGANQPAFPRRSRRGRFVVPSIAIPATRQSPYKPWQGAQRYERRRETSPAFYVHRARRFVGAGLWQPETAVQHRVRQFIFDNPASWQAAARPGGTQAVRIGPKTLRRPLRDFHDVAHIEDLLRSGCCRGRLPTRS